MAAALQQQCFFSVFLLFAEEAEEGLAPRVTLVPLQSPTIIDDAP